MCTTSLIRKIDRALFTFWLYIICRRRCVILIFIRVLLFFFVRSALYTDTYFTRWHWHLACTTDAGLLLSFCRSSVYMRFVWPKCAIFFCASLEIRSLSFSTITLFCRYRYVRALCMAQQFTSRKIRPANAIHNRIRWFFVVFITHILFFSYTIFIWFLLLLLLLFIFFFCSVPFHFVHSLFSYFLIFKIK